MSRPTLQRAAEVVAAAREDPERYGRYLDDMDRTGRVSGAHRQMVVARKAAAIAAAPPPLPTGPFDVVVADPPWAYRGEADPSQRGACPYPAMSTEDLCDMPVAEMACEDAVLWLWTTNFHLLSGEAAQVVDAWGFTPRTMLTWDKERIGTGDWLRGQTEHAILAVRGRPVVVSAAVSTLLRAPAGGHSTKPDEFFALVESMCPGSRLELFSRRARPGWSAWGDEAVS